MQLLTKIMVISLALVTLPQLGKAMDYEYPYSKPRNARYNRSWQNPAEVRKGLLETIDRERAAHAATIDAFDTERAAHAETVAMLRGTLQISQNQLALCLSQAEIIARLAEKVKVLEEAIETFTTSSEIWSESAFPKPPSSARAKATAIVDDIKIRKRMQEKEFLRIIEHKNQEILAKETEIAALRSALGVKSSGHVPFSPVMTALGTSHLPDGAHLVPEFRLTQ